LLAIRVGDGTWVGYCNHYHDTSVRCTREHPHRFRILCTQQQTPIHASDSPPGNWGTFSTHSSNSHVDFRTQSIQRGCRIYLRTVVDEICSWRLGRRRLTAVQQLFRELPSSQLSLRASSITRNLRQNGRRRGFIDFRSVKCTHSQNQQRFKHPTCEHPASSNDTSTCNGEAPNGEKRNRR
jgi:hypothetical protein